MPDADMKDWQKGLDIDYLKSVSGFYADHEAPYTFGAFSRMSETMVASSLDAGHMVLDLPRYAFTWIVATGHKKIVDWVGPVTEFPPGAFIVRRVVYAPDALPDAVQAIRAAATGRDLWLETWRDDPAGTALAEALGLAPIATRIKASSELVGVWGASPPLFMEHRDATEYESLAQLDLPDMDVTVARKALDRVSDWADHYSSYNKGKSWTAVALRGYGGLADFIIKPSEMSKKWRADHPAECGWSVYDTPLREAVPEFEELIGMVPGECQRIRLMRLAPGGGELTRHADITDPESGVADDRIARIHIPLVTNPEVRFTGWLPDGSTVERHMACGEAWYLDTRKPHRAVNGGDTPRVHLVLDVRSSGSLRSLIRTG